MLCKILMCLWPFGAPLRGPGTDLTLRLCVSQRVSVPNIMVFSSRSNARHGTSDLTSSYLSTWTLWISMRVLANYSAFKCVPGPPKHPNDDLQTLHMEPGCWQLCRGPHRILPYCSQSAAALWRGITTWTALETRNLQFAPKVARSQEEHPPPTTLE